MSNQVRFGDCPDCGTRIMYALDIDDSWIRIDANPSLKGYLRLVGNRVIEVKSKNTVLYRNHKCPRKKRSRNMGQSVKCTGIRSRKGIMK